MKFIENPTEILLSVVAIGMGAWLPTLVELKDNDLVKVFATLFAVVGGAVLSRALSSEKKIKDREAQKWKKHYHDRINPINRHLGSLTKEIYATINKFETHTVNSTEALRLISQMTPTLVGAMTDIGEVISSKFEPSRLYETTQQIEELTTLLNSIELSGDVTQKELVAEVKDRIASIHPDVYNKVKENVSCPFCSSDNEVHIGKMHPASQMVSCTSCELPFHSHRASNSSIFTSKPGTFHVVNTSTKVDVECKCGSKFTAKVKGEKEERNCLACKTPLIIFKTGEVQFIDNVSEPTQANNESLTSTSNGTKTVG